MKYFNCPMSSSLFSSFQENTKCESTFSQIHVRFAYLFFCICECRYIAIVRVPEVCKRAYSQSATAYRWNDVMIIISKWRFTEGWNKGKFVNLQLKLNIKRSQNNVILLVWIWQMSIVHFWQAFEGFHHLIRSGNELIRNFYRQTNYWLMALRYYYETMKEMILPHVTIDIVGVYVYVLLNLTFLFIIGDFN
jgi:hypothetical protein